jgi:arginyl-tRNA synthetase
MHVGHGRNAVTGDALARLLEWTGHQVTREYYVNDHGAQVQTLARSVHLRYQELFGRQVAMPPRSYPGEYVIEIARRLRDGFGDRFLDAPEAEWLPLFRDRAVEHVLGLIREDLSLLDIGFDRWSSEKALYESGTVERFLRSLEEKGLVADLPPRRAGRSLRFESLPRPGRRRRRLPAEEEEAANGMTD